MRPTGVHNHTRHANVTLNQRKEKGSEKERNSKADKYKTHLMPPFVCVARGRTTQARSGTFKASAGKVD